MLLNIQQKGRTQLTEVKTPSWYCEKAGGKTGPKYHMINDDGAVISVFNSLITKCDSDSGASEKVISIVLRKAEPCSVDEFNTAFDLVLETLVKAVARETK